MSGEQKTGVWRDGKYYPWEERPVTSPPRIELTTDALKELARAIGEGVGQASVCWDPMDCTGTFMTGQASLIVDSLIAAAVTYADTVGREESIPDKARMYVYSYVKEHLSKSDIHTTFSIDEVYVVWSCKTLQNWKCLVSTTLPDGMYYEVTYDGDKKKIYFDAYKHFRNISISEGEDSIA
jgi:hypothetical protein